LKDEDSNVRWRAAEALGQIGSDRAVDALFSALKDKNGFVRLRAAIALGQVGSDRVVDALFSALKDEDSNVRWRAAEALGRIGSDRAVDALISALKDDDSDVRDRAAEALGQIGSDRAVDALFSALKDKNGFVHLRAADALGQIGSERAVDALLAALKDDDTFVRGSAASGLADLPDKAITAGLSRSLSHTDDFIRRKAVQVIGYYRTDTAMLEELSRLAESDPSEEVRRAASDAREKFIRKLQLFGLQQTAIEMQREHFIRQKYHEALNEEDIHIKGRALEELLAALIASIEGFIEFERNVITADEEIDIVFRNESRDPFWQKFGPVFLVECKNWKSQRVGKNEFNDLRDKIKNRAGQCNLGFLVCTEVFADTIDTRMLRFSRGKRLIIPIDGERLRQLVESSDRSALLKQFTTDASLK
jgi:HEAT repeat protein